MMDLSFFILTSYYSRTVAPFVVYRIPYREHFVAHILLVYHYRVFMYSHMFTQTPIRVLPMPEV